MPMPTVTSVTLGKRSTVAALYKLPQLVAYRLQAPYALETLATIMLLQSAA